VILVYNNTIINRQTKTTTSDDVLVGISGQINGPELSSAMSSEDYAEAGDVCVRVILHRSPLHVHRRAAFNAAHMHSRQYHRRYNSTCSTA